MKKNWQLSRKARPHVQNMRQKREKQGRKPLSAEEKKAARKAAASARNRNRGK